METIGSRIKKYREQVNMTQEELAKKIDTSPQNIYKYEKNIIQNIPINKIQIMANIFGITPGQLIGWDEFPSSKASEPPEPQTDVLNFQSLSTEEKALISAFRTKPKLRHAINQLLDNPEDSGHVSRFHDDLPSSYVRVATPLKPINYGPKKK